MPSGRKRTMHAARAPSCAANAGPIIDDGSKDVAAPTIASLPSVGSRRRGDEDQRRQNAGEGQRKSESREGGSGGSRKGEEIR